ncbi:GpE family phage tail protein [Comamonas aquatica]|nr:GpE family phage tail protein [Comamonas aquatica]MDH0380653.1 GpE family phage tail protein [Comamonas aquatica]MDH0429192.1 GpE family phage tail protein [Comamonas aquatica]MDH0940028.1 GpE family phage tail protein [Comamonas aquatica]
MAEVAYFFHWSLCSMDAMPLEELLDWRERAVGIHNRINAPES